MIMFLHGVGATSYLFLLTMIFSYLLNRCFISPLQSEYLVTFPAASPGFVQLQTEELTGSLEVTLMFRTGQRRGMLAYLQDADRFFYVSLALVDGGALELRVFPQVIHQPGNSVILKRL